MAGIVFYFEDNERDLWSGRRVDLDAWNYASKIAGDIDSAICVNLSSHEVKTFDRHVDFQTTDTVPELPGKVVQVICPWRGDDRAVSLWDFDHEVDWYVFGPSWGHKPTGPHVVVPQAGRGAAHAVHVATVVMAHRFAVVSGGY